jgi:hypothetical protein
MLGRICPSFTNRPLNHSHQHSRLQSVNQMHKIDGGDDSKKSEASEPPHPATQRGAQK